MRSDWQPNTLDPPLPGCVREHAWRRPVLGSSQMLNSGLICFSTPSTIDESSNKIKIS